MSELSDLTDRIRQAIENDLEPSAEIMRRFVQELTTITLDSGELLRSLKKFQEDNQVAFDQWLQGFYSNPGQIFDALAEIRELSEKIEEDSTKADDALTVLLQSGGGERLGDGLWGTDKTFTKYNQFLMFDGVPYRVRYDVALPYDVTVLDPAQDSNFHVVDDQLAGDGLWKAGKVFTVYNQFLFKDGIPYHVKETTPLPYVVQSDDPINGLDKDYIVSLKNEEVEQMVSDLDTEVQSLSVDVSENRDDITHYQEKFYPEYKTGLSYPLGFKVWFDGGYYRAKVPNATATPDDITEWEPASFETKTSQANIFEKEQVRDPAFKKVGVGIQVNSKLVVSIGGSTFEYLEDETVSLPTELTPGTDYAVYATPDGVVASKNFTTPDGYTDTNSRRIGGFHNGVEGIKEYSIYDLKFRPACPDPRGMVRHFSNKFWADIYLLNTTPDVLGTSSFGATIADGENPPKIPEVLGGDGSQQYSNLSQYTANEVLACYGKRSANYSEFQALAWGSVTGHAIGTDPVNTQHDPDSRSLIGCEQVSGHMWQWGIENWDRGNGASGYEWYDADTNNRGQVYTAGSNGVGAPIFGANWGGAGPSGSASSSWSDEPWSSTSVIAARGLCDHLELV